MRLGLWGSSVKFDVNEEGKTVLSFGADYKKLKPNHMNCEFGSRICFIKWRTLYESKTRV